MVKSMKDTHSLVSIIMPTYNREKTIKRAINSLINQTYKNIEIIIVDDGSKDNTVKLIKEYKDKRIKLFSLKENKGANYARNKGLQEAKGEFITFQDSDDEAHLNKIEELHKFLLNNKCDVVFCNVQVQKNNKYTSLIRNQINDNEIFEKLLYGNFISMEALFGYKNVFVNEPFDNELVRFHDWDLVIRLAKNYKVKHLNKVLENVFVQNDSITRNNSKGVKGLEQILNKYKELFNNKQLARLYCRIGMFLARDSKPANKWFKKAYKTHFKLSYFILYLLNKIHLIKLLYNLKEKI